MSFTAKVITTVQWGAKAPTGSFSITTPRYVVIHHTDNQNPPNDPSQRSLQGAMRFARNIQKFHMNGNGWRDSGHNFLNTTGGFILEGRHGSLDAAMRGLSVQSAHAAQDAGKLANGNQSPGIENKGNFMTFRMEQTQWESLVELCTSLCDSCNISPVNIKGHRDFSHTDCPGDWLYDQLPQLRKEVAEKLGLRFTIEQLKNNSQSVDLKFGSKGAAVIQLQQKLRDAGFQPGAIDGDFGENTEAAVKAFQRFVGLTDNGIAGIQTRTALRIT